MKPRRRKPRRLSVFDSPHLHARKTHPEDLAVHVHNQLYYYSIRAWVGLIDRAVGEFSGRGVPAAQLRLRARGAIQSLIQTHIDASSLGRIGFHVVNEAIRTRLSSEILSQAARVKDEREHEEVKRALSWKQYLARQQPPGTELQRRFREYVRNRARLAASAAQQTLSRAFTAPVRDGIRLRIGLDLGTTGVKAAYRTEDQGDDKTVPLALSNMSGIDGFILTPSLHIEDGYIRFSPQRSLGDASLKRCLSCGFGGSLGCRAAGQPCQLRTLVSRTQIFSSMPYEDTAQFLATVYIGFVLDRVRKALCADLRQRFGQELFQSFIHMCVPVGELENPLCNSAFQDALTLADQMFHFDPFAGDSILIPKALEQWNECRRLGILDSKEKRRSRVFPEVVAEMASYATSKSAAPGVYALIDIGAGTVDINIFRWVEPSTSSGAKTPIFAAYCDGTGVLALEERLMEILGEEGPNAAKLFDAQKKKRTFPDNHELSQLCPANAQARNRQALDGAVTEFTNAIANNSQRAWHQALLKRGIEKDWDKMGVFIGGGGAAIRRVCDTLQQGMQNQLLRRVEVRQLPAPDAEQMERVSGLPLQDFHRIAVAYGLTVAHNFEDNLIWPRDIKPREIERGSSLIPSRSKYEDRYISKDMV